MFVYSSKQHPLQHKDGKDHRIRKNINGTAEGTDAQVEQLKEAGCDRIFHEKVSTRTPEEKRIQLQAALATLEEGR